MRLKPRCHWKYGTVYGLGLRDGTMVVRFWWHGTVNQMKRVSYWWDTTYIDERHCKFFGANTWFQGTTSCLEGRNWFDAYLSWAQESIERKHWENKLMRGDCIVKQRVSSKAVRAGFDVVACNYMYYNLPIYFWTNIVIQLYISIQQHFKKT